MPYTNNMHVNAPLTNVAVAYENTEFIGDKIFPNDLAVAKESDLITVFDEARRIESSVRANGAEANQVKYGVNQEPYALVAHALKDIITDRDRKNADSVIALDIDTTKFLMELLKLNEEKAIADLIFSDDWANSETRTSGTSWDPANYATVDPSLEVDDVTADFRLAAGVKPNLCVLGDTTLVALKNHPKVQDRIKYAEKVIITADLIAALFDIPRVLVGSTSYNAAKEGVTDSFQFLWGAHAWIGYMNSTISKRAYTAAFRLRMNDAGKPFRVKKWRDEPREGDWVEVQTFSKPHLVADRCGYYIANAGLGA